MAYDEGLAERIRQVLGERTDVEEKKMFGGLAFMVRDYMCIGITGEDLMVRVGADDHEAALAEPHARPMDFTGRSLKGFVYVAAPGYEADTDLAAWVSRGLDFVTSLPDKA